MARLTLRLLMTCAFVGAVVGSVSCAHQPPAQQRDARRLRALEASFHDFTAIAIAGVDDIEPAIARLESLRLEYLDALTASTTEADRLLALLRLAELHLDVSARIRRVPYGSTSPVALQRTFDAALSARALPLEATGISLLQQLVQRSDDAGLDGRFVRRARLYLCLHTDARLSGDDIDVLRTELVATTFAAPRSLLDTGRIGQRAARR